MPNIKMKFWKTTKLETKLSQQDEVDYVDEMSRLKKKSHGVNFDVLEEKWKHFFRFLDYNKDNCISEKDFNAMGWNICEVYNSTGNGFKKTCLALMSWWAVFKKHVGSTRHILMEGEFVNTIRGLYSKDKPQLKGLVREMAVSMFNLLDVNGDGVISRPEYVKMFNAMGVNQTCYVGRVFDRLDTDKSGVLEEGEFLQAMLDFFFCDVQEKSMLFIFKFPEKL